MDKYNYSINRQLIIIFYICFATKITFFCNGVTDTKTISDRPCTLENFQNNVTTKCFSKNLIFLKCTYTSFNCSWQLALLLLIGYTNSKHVQDRDYEH